MGLLQLVPESDLAPRPPESADPTEAFISGLAAHIRTQWELNKRAKREVEDECLSALRQRNGEYDTAKLSEIRSQGGSEIFLPLTNMQCVAASSWILDTLMPAGGSVWPFGLDPTPIPDLPPEVQQELFQRVKARAEEQLAAAQQPQQPPQATQQPGQAPGQVAPPQMVPPQGPSPAAMEQVRQSAQADMNAQKDAALQALRDRANREAKDSHAYVADQLVESGFFSALEDFVDDFTTFPSAILKTTYQMGKVVKWGPGGPVVREEVVERDVRVSPFDLFPAPGQTTVDDGNLIERIKFRRSDLYDLIGVEGYSEEAIRRVLDQYKNGGLRDWESYTDSQQYDAEKKGDYFSDDGLITGIHYWGSAPGSLLIDWGMPADLIEDEQREYQVDAILVGSEVIRVGLNADPLGRRPYYKASYRNRPGSFWGLAIPQLIKHHQQMCNALARAISNNAGIASGPQIMVMVDRLPKGEQITGLYPWKTWQVVSDPQGNAQKPIDFFQPASNAQELMALLQFFWEQVADITGISRLNYSPDPKLAAGQQSATGMALLYEASGRTVKGAVAHIDQGVIVPRVKRCYEQGILDGKVSGDCKVIAMGARSVSARASRVARLLDFLQVTNNPQDGTLLGPDFRVEALRTISGELGLPQWAVPDATAARARMEQASRNAPQDPRVAAAQINLQARIQDQQLEMEKSQADRQARMMLAQQEHERALQEIAAKQQISMEQLRAQLGEAAIKIRGDRQLMQEEAQIKAQFGSGV